MLWPDRPSDRRLPPSHNMHFLFCSISTGRVRSKKLVSQVLSSDATQFRFYFWLFFRLVPEEEHPLCQFLARRFRAIYRFERIRMVACGPSLSAHGHGSGRKVLHLFQLEVHPFRQHGQLRHVFFRATRMAADEVRDDLLAQPGFPVNSIEYVLKLPK